jgi:Kef-type K+ transport system membrane component KefB
MLLGPYALQLHRPRAAPILADLGVVFLVFTLGLNLAARADRHARARRS